MKNILKRPGKVDPREIIEKQAVKELVEFERYCRDNSQWEEMKKCYLEDSVVKTSWYQGDGWGFVDASVNFPARIPHKILSSGVWLNKTMDKAATVTQAVLIARNNIDGQLVDLFVDAQMLFCLKKVDEQWYIYTFESIMESDRLIPVVPGNITIPQENLADFRESNACFAYTNSLKGIPADKNVPGVDKPETTAAIWAKVDSWLD